MSPDEFESSLETTNLVNKEADVPAIVPSIFEKNSDVGSMRHTHLYRVFAVSFIWDVY